MREEESFSELLNKQRTFFGSHQTKDVSFRKRQLKKLKAVLLDSEEIFLEAIYSDFGKSPFETIATELGVLIKEIEENLQSVKKWSRRKKVKTNLINFPARSYIQPEPLGNCFIIGAWNYPIQLSLLPLITAMAAGNTAIVKPSEMAPATSKALADVINVHFEEEYIQVVEGGVEETTELLKLKFDKIFFTGSPRVGKIIYKAAAENLTPVTLELGGKSPAVVTRDCNLKTAVRRLVWAKYLNAGQTCIAPDYVLVDRTVEKEFLEAVVRQIEKFDYAPENDNYTRIINETHWDRLMSLIERDKLVCGGSGDREKLTIEPTVMAGINPDDAVMEEEIFGPLMPVISFEKIDDAIRLIRSFPKPLALYLFSEKKSVREKVLREVSFGGGAINETIMHITNPNLPFGGVGNSGTGSYHGEFGFRAFSHYKSIMQKPGWLDPIFKYPPYSSKREKWMRWALGWKKSK
ncbi:MAG: aldehyde dehydrogenase [Saprospirales bacterium]|nr:MAG: aldehyde dehydrogenase [Saprospirales bacterium]